MHARALSLRKSIQHLCVLVARPEHCHHVSPSNVYSVLVARREHSLHGSLLNVYSIIMARWDKFCHGSPYMSSVAVCFPGLLWIVRNTLVTKECDPGRSHWKRYLEYFAISGMIPRKGNYLVDTLGKVT